MSEILGRLRMGIAVGHRDTRVLSANARFARILGRDLSDVIGLRMRDVTYPDDVECNETFFDMAGKTGQPFMLRKRYVRPSGQAIWVESRYFVLDGCPDAGAAYLLLSRRIMAPSPGSQTGSEADLADYVSALSRGLAVLARRAVLPETEELLLVASGLAGERARTA
ncbi:PAS domain-containing protein [Caulobacter segnis]|uniref:PAS domain-containing protein n=1 Tax=Caulobacter segnis TaxID=88688 RepID=UPI00240EC919|nr:PAS domain-containing protein [Caulobacter segnis]MDG2520384.1 PAS domain-containing protein [Caulobacter segnis]